MTPKGLANIHQAAFTTPRPWSASEIATLIAQPNTFVVTRPQGFVMGRVVLGEAELLTLAVMPQAQGKGLGRALLDDFEQDACAQGATSAFLEVASDNAPAVALYTRAGYGESGRRAHYYTRPDGSKVDAVIMSRALAQS